MHGSFSIKAVLPAVAPDLSYGDMETHFVLQLYRSIRWAQAPCFLWLMCWPLNVQGQGDREEPPPFRGQH